MIHFIQSASNVLKGDFYSYEPLVNFLHACVSSETVLRHLTSNKSKSVTVACSVISDRTWMSAEDEKRVAALDGGHAEVKDDYNLLALSPCHLPHNDHEEDGLEQPSS